MTTSNFSCVKNDIIECDVVNGISALFCVICAAMAAGMTMGLLSLDIMKLRIKLVVGTDDEKMAISRITPLLSDHHFLLCTLLIFNAVSNEALPIFLDAVVPSWAAVVISVTLVLIFGEIIPTALFTGPNQLIIASRFSFLVKFLQILFYPIARPMASLLDKVLGVEEEDMFNREEISAMLALHSKKSFLDDTSCDDNELPLSENEVDVLSGVLGLAKRTIRDVFIKWDKVNCISSDQILDAQTIEAIDRVGHSRLPVFKGSDRQNVVGFFLVKKIIHVNPEKGTPLSSFQLHEPIIVGLNQSLLNVMNMFTKAHSHLAIVSENPEKLKMFMSIKQTPSSDCAPAGIVTIEDIFEAMLKVEIYDEGELERSTNCESASMHLRELSMRSTGSSRYGQNFLDDLEHGAMMKGFKNETIGARKSADNAKDYMHNHTDDDDDMLHASLLDRRSESNADRNAKFLLSTAAGADRTATKKITPSLVTKYIRNRSTTLSSLEPTTTKPRSKSSAHAN